MVLAFSIAAYPMCLKNDNITGCDLLVRFTYASSEASAFHLGLLSYLTVFFLLFVWFDS